MNATNGSSSKIAGLSVSVVVFRSDLGQLTRTLIGLGAACEALREIRPTMPAEFYLVDNGGVPDVDAVLDELRTHDIVCTKITGHGNVGYGRGHNLAIERATSRYHLVLNPDIDLDREALVRALDFFETHPEPGLLTPWIGDEPVISSSCAAATRRCWTYSSAAFCRRGCVLFGASCPLRNARSINDRDIVWDPPIVSGCFMLFRTDVLKKLGGFDPRYFLYFEDYDLSLRTHEVARVAYVPSVHVLHHGGGAARKGSAHIKHVRRVGVQVFQPLRLEMDMSEIVVTGANGFVGRALCRPLVRRPSRDGSRAARRRL